MARLANFGQVHEDLHWCWLCFPPCFRAAVGFTCVVLAMIGPRINQGLVSLAKAVIVGFAACMQWLVFGLCGVGMEGWVCLRNLGLGATQTELYGWISSPQPRKNTGKGSQGLRDCEAEKRLIPGVWCVWVS